MALGRIGYAGNEALTRDDLTVWRADDSRKASR